MTPWGESGDLRDRRVQPGPGVPRDEVERNHRERLYGATVAVVAEKGYAATTVADLTAVAGVSRGAFYRYFDDKEACFLATLEPIIAGVSMATRRGLEGGEPERDRAEAGLRAFVELLVAQPDAARLCLVEAEAVPAAVAVVDRAARGFEDLLAEVLDELPGRSGMPREIVTAIVGGGRKMLQTRLQRRTEGELPGLIPAVVDLALAVQPPPDRLPDRPPRGGDTPRVDREHGIDEPAQSLERAAMAVIAREGYAEATMTAIAAKARVSLATLYANFDDKADLFEAALLRARLRMAAATVPAYRRAGGWPQGVAPLVRVGLAFLEAEPDFARLITVDVAGAGSVSIEARDRAIDTARDFIAEGAEGFEGNPVAAELIQSVLYAMLVARIRSRHQNLQGMAPLAIYMLLAPFLGPEEAYRHAAGRRRRRRRRR